MGFCADANKVQTVFETPARSPAARRGKSRTRSPRYTGKSLGASRREMSAEVQTIDQAKLSSPSVSSGAAFEQDQAVRLTSRLSSEFGCAVNDRRCGPLTGYFPNPGTHHGEAVRRSNSAWRLCFQNRIGTAALSGPTTIGSVRFDTCLVMVANISAAQNAPISAENIKRGPTTQSLPLRQRRLGRPSFRSQS
jgi:hypothetical protein